MKYSFTNTAEHSRIVTGQTTMRTSKVSHFRLDGSALICRKARDFPVLSIFTVYQAANLISIPGSKVGETILCLLTCIYWQHKVVCIFPYNRHKGPKAQGNLHLYRTQMSPVHEIQCFHRTTHIWTATAQPKQHCSSNCPSISKTFNLTICYCDKFVLNNHSLLLYNISTHQVYRTSLWKSFWWVTKCLLLKTLVRSNMELPELCQRKIWT
jgi:hypothetical protein